MLISTIECYKGTDDTARFDTILISSSGTYHIVPTRDSFRSQPQFFRGGQVTISRFLPSLPNLAKNTYVRTFLCIESCFMSKYLTLYQMLSWLHHFSGSYGYNNYSKNRKKVWTLTGSDIINFWQFLKIFLPNTKPQYICDQIQKIA